MSAHDEAQLARIKFRAHLHRRGWDQDAVTNAMSGWRYVMDMTCDHRNDRYDRSRMGEGDGSDEALDMATPGRNREAEADEIYEGIKAALDWIDKTYGNRDD